MPRRTKRTKQTIVAKQSNNENNGVNLIAAKTRSHLKPTIDRGDEVYAKFTPDSPWCPGTITSQNEVETNSPYGPRNIYHIEWDHGHGPDGAFGVDVIEDHHVLLKSEYMLCLQNGEKSDWIGVQNILDINCGDEWAQKLGWWVATIDGQEQPFSLLADAIEAYDKSVVEKWESTKEQGEKVKESDLNLPKKWRHLFKDDDPPPERDHSASEEGKLEESSQNEEAEEKYKVLVQFPDGEFGEIETVGSQTIDAFKEAIGKNYGRASVTTKMTAEGMQLENHKRLSDYNIQSDSIVAAQMQIYVGFLSKKGFLLDVDPFVTIAEVKAMIESKEQDFSMSHQRIFSEGNNLENEMTLLQCDISDGDNLFVLVREDIEPPKDVCIQIYVKCDEKIHTLDVTPTDTIAFVQSMLWKKERVIPDYQRLSFGGRYLENTSRTLWDCGINSECLLYLVSSDQELQSENIQAHHVEHEIVVQEHEQSAQRNSQTQDEETITIFLMNPEMQTDGIPFTVKQNTSLSQIFSDYARRINTPTSNLQFIYGEYGDLPSDCEFTACALGLNDGDTILVNSIAPSFMPHMLNEQSYAQHNSILDLTGFSTGSNTIENSITVTLQGMGEETRVKIDGNVTTLQLIFNSFADRKNVDPASLIYVCDARRFSHEADETAAQGGIYDGDVIHAIKKKDPPTANSILGEGKMIINLLEIGRSENEKDFFNIDVNIQLSRVFKSYASRKNIELSKLRFLFHGRILYADPEDDMTPAQLGVREGDIIFVLIKKIKQYPLTPNAIKTMCQMPPDQIFEPVVQVIDLDKTKMELKISDGKNSLSLPYHFRLNALIESGVISKFATIWANAILVETNNCNQPKNFSLQDAHTAAPNSREIIGSPTNMSIVPGTLSPTDNTLSVPLATRTDQRQVRRLGKGLPWLQICCNKNCSKFSHHLKMCSRCHFVGYCSSECQSQSWKAKHRAECRYYEAYYEFVQRAEEESDAMEIADLFSFWSDQQEKLGPSKPLTNIVAASICNSSLNCAFSLLEVNILPLMAKAYILNAAFLRQCCSPTTPLEVMVDWYEIGSEGVALDQFFSRVPLLKAGHEAISTKASMLAYLEENHVVARNAGSTSVENEVSANKKTSNRTRPSGDFVGDWTVSQHIFKLPGGEGSQVRRNWLSRTSYEENYLSPKFYCPQVGDSVVYIPRSHSDALAKFPVAGYSYPWKSWPKDSSWPAVRCAVTHVRYRFPYKKWYKSRMPQYYLRSVAAIVTLEITGVPYQSTQRQFPWPTPLFVSTSKNHSFDVTVFECFKENFIIPECLYSWRINGLESAIEKNNGSADGLHVFAYVNGSYKDEEDPELDKYRFQVSKIEEGYDHKLHFMGSGYNAITSEEGESFSPWNVSLQRPSTPPPVVPTMTVELKKEIEKIFQKVVHFDPKIKEWFYDPVDTREYTDYLDTIEVPMYLSLIQQRLQQNYYTNKCSIIADMELVKENCHKYNDDGKEFDENASKIASLMHKGFKSMMDLVVEEGQVMLKFASDDREVVQYHHNLSHDLKPLLKRYSVESGMSSKFLHFACDQTTIYSTSRGRHLPSELGMKSRGTYSIRVSILSVKERHSQELIANFVQHRHRLRKVRKIVARNAIASFIWRCHEQRKARVAIADFIWHYHLQNKARKTIADLLWGRIALRRRQKLRNCAKMVQKIHRGHSTRKIYGGPLQICLEKFRRFSSVWKQTVEQVPTSVQSLTGWALVRERIDVKKMEFIDEDGNLADTDEKLNRALAGAFDEEGEAEELEEVGIESKFEDLTMKEKHVDAKENFIKLDWSQFQVTAHVVKFIKNGDAKYREIFVKRMKQLAKGERSHKLQKPLKGCESVIYESYLENKSGFRILWTQEGDRIVVWFIAKHKSVSRLAKLIDDAKNRTARQQLPESFVSELENGNSTTQEAKREILLDALGNVPLKLYDVSFENVNDIVKKSWTPQMHLSEEERKVVEAKGTVLLLGRSGTGKTICICNRIEFDRLRLGHKPNFSQLFISRSSQLCRYVKDAVGSNNGSSFTTFDKLVGNLLELPLPQIINRSFHPCHHVDFARFNRDFYTARYPHEDVSALIVWKAIRTFLKGSIEAFQTPTGLLSREYFVGGNLGKNRCKVPPRLHDFLYDILLQYQLWITEQCLWDDCDRTIALLKRIEDAKKSHPSIYEEKIKKSKLYVDEVQDYTQLEILLFFYIGGGPGSLFLAGDPAQSVVEGTDFRFEEVRSVGYFVAGNERRHLIPEKPKIVNVNFRSHAGVLNCAAGFLDLLFTYFPGSAKQLKKDFGLFKGARPGVFHNVLIQQLSILLREKMPGAVVLTHDESASRWREILGHKLVYGIREAKGMEFKSVIILDFFAELPTSVQKPWRNLLLNREGSDFESRFPLVETHIKLVYTAVTRCIEQLFFAETSSSVAGDAAVRWLTTTTNNKDQANSEALATINNVKDLESMTMTNDEFCVVGIDNAELAESSEFDFQHALSYLHRAIYCFQEAQSPELVAKAQAQCLSVQLREKLIQIGSSMTEDEKEKIEGEAVHALESLLRENLLMECMNLLNSITPVLSSYTQQKLEEYVTSRIRHVLSA